MQHSDRERVKCMKNTRHICVVLHHSNVKVSFRQVRNKLADVQWNKRDLLFILRPTRRGPVDSVEFVVKKKEVKEEKGKRKLGGAVSNLARTFSIPKAKGLELSVGEVDQKFLAHVRGDFKWKGRVVNFVIRRIPRALARCSFRFTGPNFSSLTR